MQCSAGPDKQIKTVKKSINLNTGGVGDLFSVTGAVRIVSIIGKCMQATNSTTFQGVLISQLCAGPAGIDCSGMAAGDSLVRNGSTAKDLAWVSALTTDIVEYYDNAASQYGTGMPAVVITPVTPPYVITLAYTPDANTDIDMDWYIQYEPLTDGAVITAL